MKKLTRQEKHEQCMREIRGTLIVVLICCAWHIASAFFNDILIYFMYLSMAVAVCIPLRPEAAVSMYGNRTADSTVTSLLLGMLMKQFPEAASSVLLTAIMSMDYGRGYTAIRFFRRYFKSAQARRYQCQT